MRAFRGRWDGLVAAWERLVEVRASWAAAAALVAERDEEPLDVQAPLFLGQAAHHADAQRAQQRLGEFAAHRGIGVELGTLSRAEFLGQGTGMHRPATTQWQQRISARIDTTPDRYQTDRLGHLRV